VKPIVAIIGRPNVGKSTFFNRITQTKDAIVDDLPGVTRDRHYGDATWNDVDFTLVDTGGFFYEKTDDLDQEIRSQVNQAIDDADVIIFMLDGKGGVSPFDKDMLRMLRRIEKPVFYVVNKIDGIELEPHIYDFYALGIEKLYPLSAEHRYGTSDFMDDLVMSLPKQPSIPPDDMIRLAIVGRPNVGKSSLVNRIIGQERMLVSNQPGTTRDAVDVNCSINGKSYVLIDTAGIRRKGKVSKKLEKFSIIKALRSMDRCDVALIVIDAFEGVTDQDINIAGYAYERGCGCVFLLNKWDLIEKDNRTVKNFTEQLQMAAKFLNFAPVLTISALTGQRVTKIFNLVDDVFDQYATRVETGPANKILKEATEKTEPSLHKGKRLKFYYMTQISAKPPTFVCFVNYPEAVHFSYKRYLINQIRKATGLNQTPLRLLFRRRTGRIEFGKKKKRRK